MALDPGHATAAVRGPGARNRPGIRRFDPISGGPGRLPRCWSYGRGARSSGRAPVFPVRGLEVKSRVQLSLPTGPFSLPTGNRSRSVFAVRGPVFEAIGHDARLRAFGNGIPRKYQGMRYAVYVHGPVRFAVGSRVAARPVALLYSPIKKPTYSGLGWWVRCRVRK